MKHTLVAMIVLLTGCSLLLSAWSVRDDAGQELREADARAIRTAGLQYVDAFYEVKPELLEEALHKSLTKYGFYRRSPEAAYQGTAMNYEQALALASKWNKDGHLGENPARRVTILDQLDQTASIKVEADWGIDYMQLAKYDGQWKILHVLWQSQD